MKLRPAQLFDFWPQVFDGSGPVYQRFMYPTGNGESKVEVNIWVSTEKRAKMSGLPGSLAKKTPASTDLISVSMPIFCQPSLTIACSFWRSELMEVWKTTFIRTPAGVTRMPSPPRL